MKESIMIAIEVYFIAFAISILIAGLIKGMQSVIRHVTPKKEMIDERK